MPMQICPLHESAVQRHAGLLGQLQDLAVILANRVEFPTRRALLRWTNAEACSGERFAPLGIVAICRYSMHRAGTTPVPAKRDGDVVAIGIARHRNVVRLTFEQSAIALRCFSEHVAREVGVFRRTHKTTATFSEE